MEPQETQAAPQNPIQETKPILPKEPQVKSSLLFIMSILLIITVALAALFYFQIQKLSKELSKYQIQTSPTPTATTDSTANWKTYSNKIYSFMYPISWDTYIIGENTTSTLMVAPKEKVDEVSQIQGGFGGGTFLTLTINTKTEPPTWKTDEYWQVTDEPIEVDNINGTKYNIDVIQSLPGLNKGDKTTSIVIKHGNTYIQIDLLDQTYKEIFNQILSTFKFLGQTASEKKIGYIKSITPNYDNYLISVDYIDFKEDKTAPNGYKIENSSTETISLPTDLPNPVTPVVIMQTYSHASDGNFNYNQKISFSEFLQAFESNPNLKNVPYWIGTENGTVTTITEQYIP